ncbi:MAG: glycosyltransferase [Candidatus Korarchaeum sp.]|nr:glycosyltransferase [Candidatus Korarchaeum sp.]
MRLLVIAPHYNSFIKGLVEEESKLLSEVNVLVHHNILAELSSFLPFSGYLDWVRRFRRSSLLDLRDIPKNVRVHVKSTIYLPSRVSRTLGDRLAKIYESAIREMGTEFDLIHAHFTWPCGYAAVKLSKYLGAPAVVTVHENREWFLKEYREGNSKVHYTWREADALIRVNRSDSSLLREFNSSVFYIPNGFSSRRIRAIDKREARVRLGITLDSKVIFSLGALIPRKGFQYLIQAMPRVLKEYSNATCFIGGIGPYGKVLKKMVRRMGLEDKVKLLGFIPEDELSLWMSSCDVFALPSLSESFGVVQIEAMACGKLVVATRNGGSEEVVVSEDHGLLCEPGDPDDLSEKLISALSKEWDPDAIKSYALSFSWENVASRVIDVYKGVISHS